MTLDDFTDDAGEREHTFDGLTTPLIEYLIPASHMIDSRAKLPHQFIGLCRLIVQLGDAVEAERELIRHYQDKGCRDIPSELLAARATVKQAANRLLAAFSEAMFSPGGLGVPCHRSNGGQPRGLRNAANIADSILGRIERNMRGEPTSYEYRVELEASEYRVANLFEEMLHALVYAYVHAITEHKLDISREANELVSKFYKLGTVLKAERTQFEVEGVEPGLLVLRGKRAALLADFETALRHYAGGYPTKAKENAKEFANSQCHARLLLGMIVLNAMSGEDDVSARETLREFRANLDERERVLGSGGMSISEAFVELSLALRGRRAEPRKRA
jgi:hypothetical protein